jgi:long-subunit acyl-CoA synthetase (AMP-forming)
MYYDNILLDAIGCYFILLSSILCTIMMYLIYPLWLIWYYYVSDYSNSSHTPAIQGNIKLLLDDIAQLKPTVFPSVPRVLNKLHDRIMEGIGQKPAFVQWLIGKATSSKLAEVRFGLWFSRFSNFLAKRLTFFKMLAWNLILVDVIRRNMQNDHGKNVP